MTRTGLIVIAVLLAAAALAVLFWSEFVKLAGQSPQSPPSMTTGVPAERSLLQQMINARTEGGFAVTFGQGDAAKWRLAPGHRLERFSLDGGDTVFARLSSLVPLDKNSFEWPTQGLSVELPVELNSRANGKSIEVGVVARAPSGRANASLMAVYATRQAGNSGWQTLPVGGQFEMKTFRYKVPEIPSGYTNPPVLALNADPTGAGGGIELLGIYVKVVN